MYGMLRSRACRRPMSSGLEDGGAQQTYGPCFWTGWCGRGEGALAGRWAPGRRGWVREYGGSAPSRAWTRRETRSDNLNCLGLRLCC